MGNFGTGSYSVGGLPNRQFSKFSETSAKDVFGMLAEMNKKID